MDFIEQRRLEQRIFIQSLAEFIEDQSQESFLKRGLVALILIWSFPILLQPYLGLNITRWPFVALVANLVFMVGGRVFRLKFVQTIAEIVERIRLFVVVRSERREVLRLLFEELMRRSVSVQIEEAFVAEAKREERASGSAPPPTIARLFTPQEREAMNIWTAISQSYRFWWGEESDEDPPLR